MKAKPVVSWSWVVGKYTRFAAFGFGSGLAPKAPGTFGTLAAVPLVVMAAQLGWSAYLMITVAMAFAGIWICGQASRELQIDDHPGIVWDEFAGFFITMLFVPMTWQNIALGFVLFRFFDILKPWPISLFDKRLKGGLGIMLDDLMAGVYALAMMHLWMRVT